MRRSDVPHGAEARPTAPAAETPDAGAESERLRSLQGDNQRLRDMLAAASRLAEFGRFAAKQNHELRQPLFAIKGLAQLLLERPQINVDEARDFARHIVEQAERLTRLVGDARLVSTPVRASDLTTTEVSPLLLRVTSLLDWRFRKGVVLRTELDPDLPSVAIAPHKLEQILINLLSNALDAVAGMPKPIVQVRVAISPPGAPARDAHGEGPAIGAAAAPPHPGGMVEISIADSGHGVARAVRDRIFDTFFTTKGEEAGTGLGLAVSREIARGAGGDLELLDAPGVWNEPATTVFRLTLHRAPDQVRP